MNIGVSKLMLCALVLSIVSCSQSKKTDYQEKPIVVTVQRPRMNNSAKNITVSGNIEGNVTVRLGFLVAGRINFIAVQEGEMIQAGQLLASVDPTSYLQAKEIADANYNQMHDDYMRITQLYEKKSIAESEYIKISNGLKAAKAQQALQIKNLHDTKLNAPISGILLKKGVEVGEIIGQGLQLFAISDISQVKVQCYVPASELQSFSIGNKVSVYVASLDSVYKGTVVEIGTLADAATRTFPVKILVENHSMLLRPGMTAEISLGTHKEKEICLVPAESILRDANNAPYVFIADTLTHKAFKMLVSVGNIFEDKIEITEGLNSNHLVITSGQHKLDNGSAILIK